MKKTNLPSVCLIFSSAEIGEKLEIALKAGIRWVQFREKNLSRREILQHSYRIRDITLKYNSLLTINDYLDIAIAVEADGVHLGQDDLPIDVAKKIFLGIIGVSTHNLEEAIKAEEMGAHYIGYGPIFGTKTKKNALEPRGVEEFALIRQKIKIPVLAIGGIKKDSLVGLIEKNCQYVAVSSGILDGDIAKNVEAFLKSFTNYL